MSPAVQKRGEMVDDGSGLLFLFCHYTSYVVVAFHDTHICGTYERKDDFSFRRLAITLFDELNGVAYGESLLEEYAVNVLDVVYTFLCEPSAVQAQGVDTSVGDRIPCRFYVGRYILVDKAAAAGNDVCADVHKLMDCGFASQHSPVTNKDVACQRGVVGKHAVVAYHTVVSDVAICHNEVVVADDGLAAGSSAAVDGATLSYGVVVANLADGVLVVEFQVLWDGADDAAWEYAAVLSYARAGENGDIGTYPGAVADDNVVTDGGEVADFYILADPGVGM